jgi:hypothetical protein
MVAPSLCLTSTDTAAVAVFKDHESAGIAIKQLASSGFDITKLTVIGRGFHTEESVTGFYTIGDRGKFWGKYGAFWGGLWGLLFGGVFLTIPAFGPVIVAGHFAAMVVAGIEGSIAVGGLGAIGAALYSTGIPKDDAIRYEKAVKADAFLVMVHGTASEVQRARVVLEKARPERFDLHGNIDTHPSPLTLVTSRDRVTTNGNGGVTSHGAAK